MDPLVSICCVTYNHEKYIADAIESFLMQKTDFPIEIIIHDDASTDGTADIIRAYQKKYPNIIRSILQEENQYWRDDISITADIIWPAARGKYIATCEGDDFWTEPFKLQKQIDFLESHEDYGMCFHAVREVKPDKHPVGKYHGPYGAGSHEAAFEENIVPGCVHFSSLVMKVEFIREGLPQWFLDSKHKDFALTLYMSAVGRTYYVDEVMSSYRVGVENSVMTKIKEDRSRVSKVNYLKRRIATVNAADEFFGYEYHEALDRENLATEVKLLILENRFKELMGERYKDYLQGVGLMGTVKMIVCYKYPKLAKRLSRV